MFLYDNLILLFNVMIKLEYGQLGNTKRLFSKIQFRMDHYLRHHAIGEKFIVMVSLRVIM